MLNNSKFSVSGKKNVRLFGVMTKTSVLSDKNVPLHTLKLKLKKDGLDTATVSYPPLV